MDAPSLPIAVADGGGGVLVIWVVMGIFWAIGKLKEAAAKGQRREAEERRLRDLAAGVPPRSDVPMRVPGQSTQNEGEELERWLRETLGMRSGRTPTPAPTSAPRPSPAPKPKRMPTQMPKPTPRTAPSPRQVPVPLGRTERTGPLGRRAAVPLEGAEEVEERTSLEVEGDRTDYDDAFPVRGEVEIVDLDLESVRVAEARRRAIVTRERAHSSADHDAFHDRIANADAHDARVADEVRRRRAALTRAFVASEVFGRPVGERPLP
jgi:hypothetical protein